MNKVVRYFQNKIETLSNELQDVDDMIRQHELEIQSIDARVNEWNDREKDSVCIFDASHHREEIVHHKTEFLNDRQQLLELVDKLKKQREKLAGELEEVKECHSLVSYLDGTPKFFDENYDMEFGSVKGQDILKIQENERERIAADLHDSVVQKLTTLIHKSEFCSKVIDSDKARVKGELDVIGKITRECINELRYVIHDMYPMQIKDFGLRTAIVECVEQLQHSTDMTIQLDMPEKFKKINEIVEISFLRNLKELCTNSIKHSKGENIYIKVFFRGNKIFLDVADDGIGISKENKGKSGFGLSMIRERVALLNGKITYMKNKGAGSCFKISLPID